MFTNASTSSDCLKSIKSQLILYCHTELPSILLFVFKISFLTISFSNFFVADNTKFSVISSFLIDGSGYAQPNRFDVVIAPPPKLGGGGQENIDSGETLNEEKINSLNISDIFKLPLSDDKSDTATLTGSFPSI